MKITYGDAKVEDHIMLTRAQWQAIDAREKSDGVSGSGGRTTPTRRRSLLIRGRSQRRNSIKRIFAIISAISSVTSNRSVAMLRRRRLSWRGKEMMDL
jgi:hypothetical protein